MAERRDVLVIGGGVIGVCAAYYLAKAGRSVTLIERGELCSGSSYGNAGWVVPSHSFPLAAPGAVMQGLRWMFKPDSPFYIRPRLDLDLLRWLWWFRRAANARSFHDSIPIIAELGNASLALYNELIDAESIDCKYQRRGILGVFRSREAKEAAEQEAPLLNEHGIPSRMLTPDEVLELEPVVRPDNLGGVHFEEDANLKPDELVVGLASVFEGLGGMVQTHVEVKELRNARGLLFSRDVAGHVRGRSRRARGRLLDARPCEAARHRRPRPGGKGVQRHMGTPG